MSEPAKPLQHRHLTTHDDQGFYPHGHFHHHGDDHTVMLPDTAIIVDLAGVEPAGHDYYVPGWRISLGDGLGTDVTPDEARALALRLLAACERIASGA